MKIQTPWLLRLGWVSVVALAVAGGGSATPLLQRDGQSGTTLSETVSANAHWTKTFNWEITKTADPTELNLFRGDSSTVDYTVTLTKDAGTVHASIDGEVCITNGGEVDTENLMSTISVTKLPSSTVIATTPLDVSAHPVLKAGETFCYPYSVDIPSAQVNAGSSYKVTASTTITNHSGSIGTPSGPNGAATVQMPSNQTPVHNGVVVSDDIYGQLGTFSESGTKSYTHLFSCDADKGDNHNTASITYEDDKTPGPSATATVTVNCYALDVSKTVTTSLKRTYTWVIKKSANPSSLALVTGQTANVDYTIDVDTTSADSSWAAAGKITVHNPAPIDATINSVADAVGDIDANSVDCSATFPYTLAKNTDLVCNYKVDLPNASSGTNTATAILQNHADGTESGKTDFTGTAPVDFSSALIDNVDATAALSDTYSGSGLPDTVDASNTPTTYQYTRVVGPYSTPGSYTVDNTACVNGIDTGKGDCSPVSVPVTVTTSGGCTLTIGYWKNHPDAITPLLPIVLGTPGGTKSVEVTTSDQAVKILSIPDSSNGIDKLDAQLLAAKLSIEKGADNSAVASTITAADNFLATHNRDDWTNLAKAVRSQVNSWATTLDQYNNGDIGPAHCS